MIFIERRIGLLRDHNRVDKRISIILLTLGVGFIISAIIMAIFKIVPDDVTISILQGGFGIISSITSLYLLQGRINKRNSDIQIWELMKENPSEYEQDLKKELTNSLFSK